MRRKLADKKKRMGPGMGYAGEDFVHQAIYMHFNG